MYNKLQIMKHILLLGAGLLFSFSSIFSQSIQIIRTDNHHIVNDSLIQVNGTVTSDELSIAFKIYNSTGLPISLKCKWEDSTAFIPNTWQKMCWGLCYADQQVNTWTAPSVQSLTAHDTNSTFVGYMDDTGYVGCEIVRYVWYNSSNPTDSVWVLVKFCVSLTGVDQISANVLHISAPYPNPSGNSASFNYHINNTARLSVFNTIGQSVKQVTLTPAENKVTLNVSSMPAGLYICRLDANGASPVYQKLIVTH